MRENYKALASIEGYGTVGRKVFQDFAHVLCQKFVETPSNADLVTLAIFGDGTLELDLTEGKARHNGYAIEPLPCATEARAWLDQRLSQLKIPASQLTRALLIVEYKVVLHRRPSLNWLTAKYSFACTGLVEAPDRKYTSSLAAEKNWGLNQVRN